jgi:hypothetical protein
MGHIISMATLLLLALFHFIKVIHPKSRKALQFWLDTIAQFRESAPVNSASEIPGHISIASRNHSDRYRMKHQGHLPAL